MKRELDKIEEKRFAEEYKKKVENDNHRHDDDIKKHQDKQKKILDAQQATVIQDENDKKKWAAVNNMRANYEKQQQIQEMENKLKNQEKKNELLETKKILQL